jgi:hypothetical protein
MLIIVHQSLFGIWPKAFPSLCLSWSTLMQLHHIRNIFDPNLKIILFPTVKLKGEL